MLVRSTNRYSMFEMVVHISCIRLAVLCGFNENSYNVFCQHSTDTTSIVLDFKLLILKLNYMYIIKRILRLGSKLFQFRKVYWFFSFQFLLSMWIKFIFFRAQQYFKSIQIVTHMRIDRITQESPNREPLSYMWIFDRLRVDLRTIHSLFFFSPNFTLQKMEYQRINVMYYYKITYSANIPRTKWVCTE